MLHFLGYVECDSKEEDRKCSLGMSCVSINIPEAGGTGWADTIFAFYSRTAWKRDQVGVICIEKRGQGWVGTVPHRGTWLPMNAVILTFSTFCTFLIFSFIWDIIHL